MPGDASNGNFRPSNGLPHRHGRETRLSGHRNEIETYWVSVESWENWCLACQSITTRGWGGYVADTRQSGRHGPWL